MKAAQLEPTATMHLTKCRSRDNNPRTAFHTTQASGTPGTQSRLASAIQGCSTEEGVGLPMKSRNSFRAAIITASVLGALFVLSIKPSHSSGLEQAAGGAGSQSPAASPSVTPPQGASPASQAAPAAVQLAPAWRGSQVKGLSPRGEFYTRVSGVSAICA